MTLDVNKIAAQSGDVGAALAAFFARAYCLTILWTAYAAPALPLWDHVYRLDLFEVVGLLGAVAVWRGISIPAAGTWGASLKSAAVYGAVGLAAAWFKGEAPQVPTSFNDVPSPYVAPFGDVAEEPAPVE